MLGVSKAGRRETFLTRPNYIGYRLSGAGE